MKFYISALSIVYGGVIYLFILIVMITILLLIHYIISSNSFEVENVDVKLTKSPSKTFTIAHVSDIHIRVDEHDRIDSIMRELSSLKPDLIALTGDILDNLIRDNSLEYFSKNVTKIAPVIAVPGNHEEFYEDYEKTMNIFRENGIIILENEYTIINNLLFVGLKNNCYLSNNILKDINTSSIDGFVLLAHRPENFNYYCDPDFILNPNLVLSGHAHGGQFRFFGRGLYSPQQGIFPIYTSGAYKHSICDSIMVVSRGLGHCDIPIRLNNKFHIPLIKVWK